MPETVPAPPSANRIVIAVLAGATVLVSSMHHITAPAHMHWHHLYQVLYYVPVVLGALLAGWKVSLGLGLLASISHLPYAWHAGATRGYAVEQIVEMSLLCVVGVLSGVLSDRDRRQRRELERTTRRLSEVYEELQRNFEQMKRAERLFAVGQLAAGLAHELRNPLWSVTGAAGILQRNAKLEPKHQECLDIINKECQRLNRLLTNFLGFARPRPPKYQSLDINALLDSVIQLASHGTAPGAVRLRIEAAPELPPIQGDPELVRQVLLNLMINAIQAMPRGGEVLVSAGVQQRNLIIRVRDEGEGIQQETRDRMFDPFFTTKENGTGLGLAVAHQIVEQHGGTLTAEENADRGMTFSVQLPLEREAER